MAQQNNLSSIPRTHTVKTEKTTTLNCPLIYICVLWNAQYAHIHTHKHTVKTDKGKLRKKRSIWGYSSKEIHTSPLWQGRHGSRQGRHGEENTLHPHSVGTQWISSGAKISSLRVKPPGCLSSTFEDSTTSPNNITASWEISIQIHEINRIFHIQTSISLTSISTHITLR